MKRSLRSSARRARWSLAVSAGLVAAAVSAGVGVESAAAAKAPIVLGDTCDCSGTSASTTGGWAAGLAVWTKWINAKGGILGHRVQVIGMDSKSDPTVGLTAAKTLLANKKVVALIPGAGSGAPLGPVVTAAKAPVVGGLGDDPLWFTNQYVFPVSTTVSSEINLVAAVGARGAKNKNAAILYCAEVAACGQAAPLFGASAKKAGGKLVYQAAVSSSAADYTAPCLAAKSAGAGYMWISGAATLISRLATSCAKNGYKPQYVLPNFSAAFLTVPALNGAKSVFGDAPYTSGPAATFRQAVAKYNPGLTKKPYWGQYVFQAWLSGQEIARALQLANPKGNAVTRADIFRGLYKMHNETLGGAAPNLTYHKGKPASVPCGYVGQVTNGKLVGQPGTVC